MIRTQFAPVQMLKLIFRDVCKRYADKKKKRTGNRRIRRFTVCTTFSALSHNHIEYVPPSVRALYKGDLSHYGFIDRNNVTVFIILITRGEISIHDVVVQFVRL